MRSLFGTCLMFMSVFISGLSTAQIIETEAEYAVIMDHNTGEVLYAKNGDVPMIPASMTKIMTAHLVFTRLEAGEITLEDRFTVSENAWRKGGWATGGSTMGLQIGETPTVEELLRGVIVLSGNDACIVLAEGLAGSEEAFAREMTDLAQDMGLTSATFKNTSGLDEEGHRISAIDLARLAQIDIAKFPEYYSYYAEREMTWNGITQANRNPLLGASQGVDGLKTGHLSVSGYGLTASAQRGGKRRIIVLNGMPTSAARAQEAERLMRLAFSSFETQTLDLTGGRVAELDVWLGEARQVGVSIEEPIEVTAHIRAFDRGTTEIVYQSPITAPIEKGEEIAQMIITLEGKDPIELPLVATESVGRLDFLGKAIEGLSYRLNPDS
ncbi:MAG: D-alanyl-D-alanine carboxypeptidase family protein [Henriciella sp.]|nr:D-alanyl-D-alanine carboxypeptidase family protein [Henriciella sp.]